MIAQISAPELEARIDEWWDSYCKSFPVNQLFDRREFSRFLMDSSADHHTLIQIAEEASKIEGAQICKVFPRDSFIMGLYIWVAPSLQGKGVGTRFHQVSKEYALANQLVFVSEVDFNNNPAWFNEQRLAQLPIGYFQPPVGTSKEWVPMKLMADADTMKEPLGRSQLIKIVQRIYEAVYGLTSAEYQPFIDSAKH
jgi:GNAT superfamily N-acetyltransferase